jgi:hypothetical protein
LLAWLLWTVPCPELNISNTNVLIFHMHCIYLLHWPGLIWDLFWVLACLKFRLSVYHLWCWCYEATQQLHLLILDWRKTKFN